jgi:hypothetical protein
MYANNAHGSANNIPAPRSILKLLLIQFSTVKDQSGLLPFGQRRSYLRILS